MAVHILLKPDSADFDKIREIRYTVVNMPDISVGDTFTINVFGRVFGEVYPVKIVGKHWRKAELLVRCEADPRLFIALVDCGHATPREGLSESLGHYQMPEQDWAA